MRPVLGRVAGCSGDDCAEGSPLDEVGAAGENEQQQQQRPPPAEVPSGPNHTEGGNDEGNGDTRKQKVELMSLGGGINATHRQNSRTAGTAAPRMISDAIRDDLLEAINEFVSKVCRLHIYIEYSSVEC